MTTVNSAGKMAAMTSPYIFSKTVCAADGTTVGTFSSHAAAFGALMRLRDPNWQPLWGKPSLADALEEKLMVDRIANLK